MALNCNLLKVPEFDACNWGAVKPLLTHRSIYSGGYLWGLHMPSLHVWITSGSETPPLCMAQVLAIINSRGLWASTRMPDVKLKWLVWIRNLISPRSLVAPWLESMLDWITTLNWLASSQLQGWDDWYLLSSVAHWCASNHFGDESLPICMLRCVFTRVRDHDPSSGSQRSRARLIPKGGRRHPNLSRSECDYLLEKH